MGGFKIYTRFITGLRQSKFRKNYSSFFVRIDYYRKWFSLDNCSKNSNLGCSKHGDDMASTGAERPRMACRDSSGFSLINWKHYLNADNYAYAMAA